MANRSRSLLGATFVLAVLLTGTAVHADVDDSEARAQSSSVDAPSGGALDVDGPRPDSEDVEGELLVDLKAGATPADVEAIVRELGGDVRWNSELSAGGERISLVRAGAATLAAIAERLRHDSHVEEVDANEVFTASFVPDDPLYSEKQWHLKKVGAERAWDYGCGAGVTVAVVDTGVACFDKGPFTRGTDLQGTRCEGGYNFVHDTHEAFDDQGHGTHVAGTVAQTTNNAKGTAGLAYCANLMPVKVLNRNGWGTLADVAEGIVFAADHGAQVINLSLGGPRPASVLEKAVKHAQAKGVLVVAAAGNSGKSVGYPAAYPGVVAVSATDSNDKIAWFSSRGKEVVIAAPGVSVTQQTICEGGKNKCEIFGTFNGTSMASPHVAGAAALVMGMGVTDTDFVKEALAKHAVEKDDAKLYGAGVLEAGKSVANVYWSRMWERVLGLVMLFAAVSWRIKKKGGWVSTGPAAVLGMLLGGIGLLSFLPLLGILPQAGAGVARSLLEVLMRPFGEWDVVFSAGLHRWLLLASAGPALAAFAVLSGIKGMKPVLGGFALGTAALVGQIGVMGDVAFPLGGLMLKLFVMANVFVLLWLARIGLDKRPV